MGTWTTSSPGATACSSPTRSRRERGDALLRARRPDAGSRPQSEPRPGETTPLNFLQLKQAGLDAMDDAMVTIEGQFPFNLVSGPGCSSVPVRRPGDLSGVLFGIGRSLYFCHPAEPKLLGYWDTVADRLFKIRNSENIQGVVQQLPLFDPPIDPGMLVKAAAAGIDIGSIVSGLNQPVGPVRAPLLIRKPWRSPGKSARLGNALLSAWRRATPSNSRKLRAGSRVALQQLVQHTRFLQYQHAMETTNGLLGSRGHRHRAGHVPSQPVGQTPDPTKLALAPEDLTLPASPPGETSPRELRRPYTSLPQRVRPPGAHASLPGPAAGARAPLRRTSPARPARGSYT